MRSLFGRIAGAKSSGFAIIQTVLANIGVLVLNIVSGIITARALGPSGRGTLAAILMWPQFLAYGLSFGIPVATVYWLKKRPDEARQIAGTGMLLSAILGTFAAALGYLVIPFSLRTYPHDVVVLAQSWVVVTPIALLAVTIIAQVQAAGEFTRFNLFRFLSPLSVLSVIFLAWLLGHLTFGIAAVAYLLAATPVTVWIGAWAWKHYQPTLSRTMSTSRMLVGYGVRAWGADLLATIASQVDRILVVGLLNPEFMGLYVVAQSTAGLLGVLPSAVSPITLPQSSGLDTAGIMELTGRAVRATLYVTVIASIPLFTLGGLLMGIVYGDRFSGAAAVLPFLLVEAIADGLTSVLAQAFLASGFPGTVTLLEGAGVMTSIPLLYLLIPRFGLPGAGMALMIATLCRLLLVLISFPRTLRRRPPGFVMPRAEFLALVNRVWKTAPSDT